MKKLPAHMNHFVVPLVQSMLMSLIVSAITTVRAVGFSGAGHVWLGSWLWSWAVAYPILFVVLPIVRWSVSYVVEAPRSVRDV